MNWVVGQVGIGVVQPDVTVLLNGYDSADGTSYITPSFTRVAGGHYFLAVASTDGGAYPSSVTQTGLPWTFVTGLVVEWFALALFAATATDTGAGTATINFPVPMTGITYAAVRIDPVSSIIQSNVVSGAPLFDYLRVPLDPFQAGSSVFVAQAWNSSVGTPVTPSAGLIPLTEFYFTGSAGRLVTGWANEELLDPGYAWNSGLNNRIITIGAELGAA